MEAKEVKIDVQLIAACGLYCAACGKFMKGSCPGCAKNEKASWCKVRSCCREQNFKSCADCSVKNTRECKKMNNFIANMFGLVFNSDRHACIQQIRALDYEKYAQTMAQNKQATIKRK